MRRLLPQVVVDAVLVALAYYVAFWLRFDGATPVPYHRLLMSTWPWAILGTVVILALSGVYRRRWRYLSQRDIERLVRGLVVAGVVLVGAIAIIHPVHVKHTIYTTNVTVTPMLPATVAVLYPVLAVVLLTVVRGLARAVDDRRLRGLRAPREQRNSPLLP